MTKKSDAFADLILFIDGFGQQYDKDFPGLTDALTITIVEWLDPAMASHRKPTEPAPEEQTAD
ncbi:hypothetical protein ABIG06_004720 [Bradyrhizobium sp. USDA 326]|uniref:hypothetical protein n=1 Tax=unclassified Bradyrhizobium TaxID=2631580 RepID=UPI0035136707